MISTATERLTEEHRQAQIRNAAGAVARTRALHRRLVVPAVRETYSPWVDAALPEILQARQRSRALAGRYYTKVGILETGDTMHRALNPKETDPDLRPRIRASMFVVGRNGYTKRMRGDQPQARALERTMSQVSGAVTRHVMNGGRDEIRRNIQADRKATGYVRITAMDANVCWFCAMLASRVDYKGASFDKSDPRFKLGGNPFANAKVHDSCVVGETLVSGPAVEVGSRRWYEGPLVIIRTAGGKELSITPNHPVLTDQGWIPAGLIRQGDQVVGGLGEKWDLGGVPEEDQQAALIEDVLSALLMEGSALNVPGAAHQFHGDGTQAEVDVVAPHGLLDNRLASSLLQPGKELAFAGAGSTGPSIALPSLCAKHHLALTGDSPDVGFMGGSGPGGDLLGSGLVHSELLSGPSAAGFDAMIEQVLTNGAASDLELISERLLGLPGEVSLDEVFGDLAPLSASPRFDPAALEFAGDGVDGYSSLGRGLRERLAGQVELDRVVEARSADRWSGHVFNLQTREGWYSGNGIIVSNCRCQIFPLFSDDLPERTEEYIKLWYDLSGDGNEDLATNFRSNWRERMLSSRQ